ncbi:hypothetical protein [Pseudomonas sp. EA_65y_Pfl2_P74]|uniref:hypothetical protein n=1 Tax=Pseudomonas sp. EA_65y_Pfl2_P74 TaxID=3088694 RepID=UPI0030DA95EB
MATPTVLSAVRASQDRESARCEAQHLSTIGAAHLWPSFEAHGSDRRNCREQADQNGQYQKSTQKKRHLVHVALLNAEFAVHWTLRDEGLSRVPELPGHFERMTELVTEADKAEKYGSDEDLIRLSD